MQLMLLTSLLLLLLFLPLLLPVDEHRIILLSYELAAELNSKHASLTL
jgi:hypothetical protein